MTPLIRSILLGASGLVLVVFLVVGLFAERAIAPADDLPSLLDETSTTSQGVASTTPETSIEIELPTPKTFPVEVIEQPITVPQVNEAIQETIDTLNDVLAPEPGVELPSNVPTDLSSLNETVRKAIVNIICTTDGTGPFNPISASGVIIDEKGVILTNAHVAQYYLLKDYPAPDFVECTIRTGSPARAMYTSELMFLPPSWIEANALKITQENPTGNGDHDYALLRIIGTTNPDGVLPSTFPYLALSEEQPAAAQEVLIAGYPAGFLGGITIQKDLYAASSIARIGELYTFGGNTLDLFSLGGSVVAQQGSSGGAVASREGTLTGLIVTSSDAPNTASRDLRALAVTYIQRDFIRELGKSIQIYLAGDLKQQTESFRIGTAPTLKQSLVNALEGR